MANSSVNARPYTEPVRVLTPEKFFAEFKPIVTEKNANGRHGLIVVDAEGKRRPIGYIAENFTRSRVAWAKLDVEGIWCLCNDKEEIKDFFTGLISAK